MKRFFKLVICLALAGVLALSFTGCAKLAYIANGTVNAIGEVKSGEWNKQETAQGESSAAASDTVVIDAFVPGTYGGIEFNSLDDVAKVYAAAFDKTKAKTALFIDEEGNKVEMYDLEGSKEITITDILVDGNANQVINKLVPQLLGSLYKPTVGGLQPCNDREPSKDNDENGVTLTTCRVTGADLLEANVVDNGDGTITLTMQPKLVEMSRVGQDAQGNMFTVLNDLGAVVDAVSIFSWASGTTEENCQVTYQGGTAVVTIDVASGEVVKADYDMKAYVKIQHANLSVVHDKSVSATVDFVCLYPAADSFYDQVNVHRAE